MGFSANLDPDGVGIRSALFGQPSALETAKVVVLPVPWNVTASYGKNTLLGPKAVLEASHQLDLSLPGFNYSQDLSIALQPISNTRETQSKELASELHPYIEDLERGSDGKSFQSIVDRVNRAGQELNQWVREAAEECLDRGQLVGVLGGEHSVPLGLVEALSSKGESFGILQIDAHADLRKSYQGLHYSHASIMHNVLECPQVDRLVQVGVRDYSAGEWGRIKQDHRIKCYRDAELQAQLFSGTNWKDLCDQIAMDLPDSIYVSFDIDGLDPSLCPGTGTPVPGGLNFNQVDFLLRAMVSHGKRIIGFDLCEVGPGLGDWDGNVGARILHRLAVYAAASNDMLKG